MSTSVSPDRNIGRARDIIIALAAGIAVEVTLAALAFWLAGILGTDHPWLQISQMPGAQIAERLFRFAGVPGALACAIVIQALIFTGLILAGLYVYRLTRQNGR